MKRLLFLLLLVAVGCNAQTTVTGTITDANGNAYANGTASAQIQTVSGQPTAPSVNTTTDSTGKFTMTLPAGSYIFTVCATPVLLNIPTTNPTPKQVCFSNTTPIDISGTSQDVSVALSASAVALGPKPSTGGVGFPSGTGIPQVNSGTSWGSTIIVGGGVASALSQTVNTSNGICTGTGGACVAPPPATNAVQYVSTTGNDSNSGTAADDAHAKATIPSALTAAAGGTVYVEGGVTSWAGGTIPAHTKLIFEAAGTVSVTAPVVLSAGASVDCSYGRSTDATPYTGGTVLNFTGLTGTQDAFDSSANGVTVKGCWIEMNGVGRHGIYLQGSSDSRITYDTVQDAPGDGIRVDNTGKQSYDDDISFNHISHSTGDCIGLRTDGGTTDIDQITMIDDECWSFVPGGAVYSGTNGVHLYVPSAAASTQTIADVQILGLRSHIGGASNPGEVFFDYGGTDTTDSFFDTISIFGGELEGDAGSGTCTGIKVSDAAAVNLQGLMVNLRLACSTDTNLTAQNATNYHFLENNSTQPQRFDVIRFDNTFSSTPGSTLPGIQFNSNTNGNYRIITTSDGIMRLWRTDTNALATMLWNPNWTAGSDVALETGVVNSAWPNYFNIAAFTGPHTTNVPDANTVLPQPLTAVANTYVTGLDGTTGALSTAVVGLTPVKKTATYTAVDADRGGEFDFTITASATFTAAPAANNWYVAAVVNDPTSTATLTIAVPSGTLTNWGGCTISTNQIALAAGYRVALTTDNTNWYAICSVAAGGSATPQAWYSPVIAGNPGGASPTTQNGTRVWPVTLQYPVSGTGICYSVQTADNTANVYDIGLYNSSGTLVAHTGATAGTTLFAATGYTCAAWAASATLPAGQYAIALTSSAATPAALLGAASRPSFFSSALATGGTTTGGALNSSITFPTITQGGSDALIFFYLY